MTKLVANAFSNRFYWFVVAALVYYIVTLLYFCICVPAGMLSFMSLLWWIECRYLATTKFPLVDNTFWVMMYWVNLYFHQVSFTLCLRWWLPLFSSLFDPPFFLSRCLPQKCQLLRQQGSHADDAESLPRGSGRLPAGRAAGWMFHEGVFKYQTACMWTMAAAIRQSNRSHRHEKCNIWSE